MGIESTTVAFTVPYSLSIRRNVTKIKRKWERGVLALPTLLYGKKREALQKDQNECNFKDIIFIIYYIIIIPIPTEFIPTVQWR